MMIYIRKLWEYRRPLRHKRHVPWRKINVGTAEFGVDLETDIGAVLSFWIGDMFHLNKHRWNKHRWEHLIALRRDTEDSIGDAFDLTIQGGLHQMNKRDTPVVGKMQTRSCGCALAAFPALVNASRRVISTPAVL
jgi:hypothetical protein